jgi:signal peptidase I
MNDSGREGAAPDGEAAPRAEPDNEMADISAASTGTAAASTGEASTVEASTAAASTAGDDAGPGGTATDAGPPGGASRPVSRRRRPRRRSFWKELPILVAVALLLAVVIKTFALQAFFIPSGSMENTLDINDRVLVNKVVYDFRGIHRGDIVVFDGDGSWDPGTVPSTNPFSEFWTNFASMFGFGHAADIYIKRVIGLPGDHVACCDAQGRVTVNGVPLSESSYLYPGDVPSESRFSIVVPPGQLWVMGDHRSVSSDSRDHMGDPGGGTVPESAVLGRAFVIIWPPSRWRFLPIPATFEQPALSKQAVSAPSASAANQALLTGVRIQPSGPVVPLSLGFAGALPLTWAQRRVRRRRRESP